MDWDRPNLEIVRRAIEAYLTIAYPSGSIPAAIRHRRDAVLAATDANLYDSSHFEMEKTPSPARFGLRLGNRVYPHMKLVIERSPDGRGHLFRADTHDRHVRPAPASREYDAFCQLMTENQRIAEGVELAWEKVGIPTFKQFLRNDLARRAASARDVT